MAKKQDLEVYEEPDFQEENEDNKEVLDVLPEFDLEALIVDGKDAIIEREIEFYNIKLDKKMKMPIFVTPITRAERNKIERTISKNNKTGQSRNINEMLCEMGWVNKDGVRFDLEDIRKVPDGVTNSIADEIRFVSGEFKDRFEDKAIEKLFGTG